MDEIKNQPSPAVAAPVSSQSNGSSLHAEEFPKVVAERFLLCEELGSGGMGEVYRAEDPVLKRSVAIKRIRPDLSADTHSRERFLREAEKASSLSNRHVAAVYDVIQDGAQLFLVMEYVEGHTLREKLNEPLELREFISIASQCALALRGAHERGIVHRDIKPENIMLGPSGEVKILDFGIAKVVTSSPASDDVTRVEISQNTTAALSGTPGYMSPEMLLQKPTDARSDIFSLGVVFYEALTGKHPFQIGTVIGTSDRILHHDPEPVRALNQSVPPALDRLVMRMLAKEPENRYASAANVLSDLETIAGGGVAVFAARRRWSWLPISAVLMAVLLVAAAAGWWWNHGRNQSGPATPLAARNIAVLPFLSLEGNAESNALGRGLTETLSTRLTQLSGHYPLQVVPPSELRAQSVTTVEQASTIFGVNLVIEGTLQQAGKLVRVNYRLVNADNRRQLRAGTITARAGNPFSLEDQVVNEVLSSLDLELSDAERSALAARGTSDPAVYNLYLRGRGYLQEYQNPENIDSAITAFKRALDLQPDYALASAGLGLAYWQKYRLGHDPHWLELATTQCDQAIKQGPNLADGSSCLGMIESAMGKYDKAVKLFQHALELDPANDSAYLGLGSAYEQLGQFDAAESTYRRAIDSRPHYWAGYNWLGDVYRKQGRYEEASADFARVIELAPENYRGYSNLGAIYLYTGSYEKAIATLQRSLKLRPTASAASNLGAAYFFQRRFSEAANAYSQALRLRPDDPSIIGNLAEADYWIPSKRSDSAVLYTQAVALLEAQARTNPRDMDTLTELAMFHAMLGHATAAQHYSQRSLSFWPGSPESFYVAAVAAAREGDRGKELYYLQKALGAGLSPSRIKNNPLFDNVSSDQRLSKNAAAGQLK